MRSESAINPLQASPMHCSPRCTARSKRTGQPCQAPAVSGYRVCRMHGARGGAPYGKSNGRFATGAYTAETIESCRWVQALARMARTLDEPP